jgi:two-component system response regulator VanR
MKKHILIVDDEVEIRDLLGLYLTSNGYQVTAFETAMEALRFVTTNQPDLIISDLQLEDSDGLEMIEKLKATLPNVPVILLTGVLFDAQVFRDTLSKKVSAYLMKTSPLAKIKEEIERLLAA